MNIFTVNLGKYEIGKLSDYSFSIYICNNLEWEQELEIRGIQCSGRACCSSFKTPNNGLVAELFFRAEDLNVGTINHEIFHALMVIFRLEKLDLGMEGNEEKMAWLLGYILGDLLVELDKEGVEYKNNPWSKQWEELINS